MNSTVSFCTDTVSCMNQTEHRFALCTAKTARCRPLVGAPIWGSHLFGARPARHQQRFDSRQPCRPQTPFRSFQYLAETPKNFGLCRHAKNHKRLQSCRLCESGSFYFYFYFPLVFFSFFLSLSLSLFLLPVCDWRPIFRSDDHFERLNPYSKLSQLTPAALCCIQ